MAPDVEKYRSFLKTGMPGPHAYVVLLGMNRFDFPGVAEKIEKGLPYSAFERLKRNTELSSEQLLDLLQIPARTLARRKATGRFSSEESDRLVRVARVYAATLQLFSGDPDEATRWLTTIRRTLGDTPLALARTEIGAQEVEKLVWQLAHGVFP